jgi:peptide subunit release factor 1 (eRF1)
MFSKNQEIFVCETFIPDLPITKNYYYCGNKFLTESIINLYNDDHKTYGLLIVSGEETIYYELLGKECLETKKIASTSVHRLKKQKKGGQRAPLYQRARLEQVSLYVKKIIELLNKNVKDSVSGIVIAGIGEIKDMIKSHDVLYPSVKQKIKTVVSTSTIEVDKVLSLIKQHFVIINNNDEKKTIEKIQNIIALNPDKLIFGIKEIREKTELGMVETIYLNPKMESKIKELNLNKVEIIKIDDKILEQWGSIIGVLRFVIEESYSDISI